jgi:division protein CdvB (Snf7/Vps24/ESCRT-III family)
MSLKYALLENLLTPNPDDYVAQLQNVTSHDLSSVIEKMLEGGSTITKTDALAVLNRFFETITRISKDGETVNLDLFRTNLSITGVFESASDSFDPKRHSININANAGKLLKDAIAKVKLEKTSSVEALPHVLEVKDSISRTVNQHITANGVIEIVGSLLKIAGDNPKNGLYFIAADGKATKALTLIDNKPARLIAMVPNLPSGEYTLQITSQYNGAKGLNSSRTGNFHKVFTVLRADNTDRADLSTGVEPIYPLG